MHVSTVPLSVAERTDSTAMWITVMGVANCPVGGVYRYMYGATSLHLSFLFFSFFSSHTDTCVFNPMN